MLGVEPVNRRPTTADRKLCYLPTYLHIYESRSREVYNENRQSSCSSAKD